MKHNKFSTAFSIFSFIFISTLLIIVGYEVTFNEPHQDDKKYNKYLNERYGLENIFKQAFGSSDEEEDSEREKHDKGWYD